MKLKRFLALAVSVIMVMAMIPAMSVSAAGTTATIEALGGEVFWTCPDGSFNDTAISSAFSGWTSTNASNAYVNVKTYDGYGNTIQYYVNGAACDTTVTSPGYGAGAEKIMIEWTMKRNNPSDLYFDFSFKDIDGIEIAFLKLDRNYTAVSGEYYMGFPAEGTDCAIVATNNGDDTHKVEYYVAGEVVSTIDSKEGTVNGFKSIASSNGRWSAAWNHIGFANLAIGGVLPETVVEVEATYTVDGSSVGTVKQTYDSAAADSAEFPAYYAYANGEIYTAAATSLSADAEIAMTMVNRYASKAVNDIFMADDGNAYKVTGGSLVVNGNFVTGDMKGWINRNLATEVAGAVGAYDEEIGGNAVTISTSGAGATNSIGTKWTVTPGETYYISFYVGGQKPSSDNYQYNKVFDGSSELIPYGANMVNGAWTRFEKVFTAANDTILFQGSWASNIKYANVELLPVVAAPDAITTVSFVNANEEVVYTASQILAQGESFTVDAREVFVLDDNYVGTLYQIPETVVSAAGMVVEVAAVADKYVALEDALITGGTEIWGVKNTNNNSVFVASAGASSAPEQDANGENNFGGGNKPSTLGTSRLGFFLFPVVDVAEGQKVTANFYVREWHSNGFANGNKMLRLAAHAVTDNSWATLSDGDTSYSAPDATLLASWNTPVFSEECYNNLGYITFDVTEVMVAAKVAGLTEITLRLNAPFGAAYIAEREAAVLGGKYEGKVAYLAVEDAGLVKVEATGAATLTKNGSAMNGFAYVTAADDVRLNATGAIVVNTDDGYYPANETMTIDAATTFANTVPAGLGLAMVDGAQVRIGATEIEDGGKLDAMADSGIRFLATANYTDTVLNDDAVDFGIKVTAEGSTTERYVSAEKFQNDEGTVFTAAITNLATTNYNRKFTATTYAKVPMADGTTREFNNGSVTRSIYQVSAGIMKNGTADGENAPYTVEGTVKNILNAYINQVGVRLLYNGTEMSASDAYTGDIFFAVESAAIEGGVSVTITPDQEWGTPAEIAEWWTDYVRVNNNNTAAKAYIENAAIVDGVLTFDFMYSSAE